MYVDFKSDWPAYAFMALFFILFAYIIVKGSSKKDKDTVDNKVKTTK